MNAAKMAWKKRGSAVYHFPRPPWARKSYYRKRPSKLKHTGTTLLFKQISWEEGLTVKGTTDVGILQYALSSLALMTD